jgi:hypothetical protein
MARIAWGLIAIATPVWLALILISMQQAACGGYAADMAAAVLGAFALSSAVQSVRRGEVRFAAFLAGATIALSGYGAVTHGWL